MLSNKINYRQKNGERTYTWKLNNMLLRNQSVNEEYIEEVRIYVEINENANKTFQNLCAIAKVVLRRKYIVIKA